MNPTILIVDDHEALRKSLLDWLIVEFPDCSVVEAASGEEAIEVARCTSPHIMVMDIGLPRMNGIEAVEHIKRSLPTVKTVMLTIHEAEEYRVNAINAGADIYIPKARMQKELLPTIAALLDEEAAAVDVVLKEVPAYDLT